MDDLRLDEVMRLARFRVPPGALNWEACSTAVAAYDENVSRMARMIQGPVYAALITEKHCEAFVTLHGVHPRPEIKQSSAQWYEVQKLAEGLINRDAREQIEMQIWHAEALNNYANNSGEAIKSIFSDLLNSIIIQAWTAFELLTEDLLCMSMALHPECFKVGEFSKRFTSRDAMIRSYKRALHVNAGIVLQFIDNREIDALSLLRNVMVHKGGRADAWFIRDIKKCPEMTPFHSLNEGEPVLLNGHILCKSIDPAMKCGYSLSQAMSDWLTANRPTPL
jgi:hypothetical protein